MSAPTIGQNSHIPPEGDSGGQIYHTVQYYTFTGPDMYTTIKYTQYSANLNTGFKSNSFYKEQ